MRTGTGMGMETRAVAEMGTGTGTRTVSGRAEERQRSAENRTKVVDVTWETEEAWVERGKNECKQERVGSVAANPDNLENRKEAGGEAHGTHGLSKNSTSRERVPFVASDQTFTL